MQIIPDLAGVAWNLGLSYMLRGLVEWHRDKVSHERSDILVQNDEEMAQYLFQYYPLNDESSRWVCNPDHIFLEYPMLTNVFICYNSWYISTNQLLRQIAEEHNPGDRLKEQFIYYFNRNPREMAKVRNILVRKGVL